MTADMLAIGAGRRALTEDEMYERVLANDAASDGRFFLGVTTTGIYCLPSCRARKPRRENSRFFGSAAEARSAGLRPCRKCYPDDYGAGADPFTEQVEALVAEVRAAPADFPNVEAMVRRSGYGATRLFDLLHRHYGRTPAELLLEARVETAKRLLRTTGMTVTEAAFAAGFGALSAFHANFKRRVGVTPAAYRALSN